MERDEAIRRAEIAMAWARGETVQYRCDFILGGAWDDVPPIGSGCVPVFFDDKQIGEWRIKPKPLECWVWVFGTSEDHLPGRHWLSGIDFSEPMPTHAPKQCRGKDGRDEIGHWVRMVEKQ